MGRYQFPLKSLRFCLQSEEFAARKTANNRVKKKSKEVVAVVSLWEIHPQ